MTSMYCRRTMNKNATAAPQKQQVQKVVGKVMLSTMALLAVSTTGCYGLATNYNLGFLGYPLPVSPYFQHKQEEKFWKRERYDRVPILGPTTSGGPAVALDPPSDDEVMHALESARPVQGGVPLLWEKQRNNVRIIKEKIADYVDPPRFYPLIGPAQLHHAHYKCTIYFDERTTIGYPIPYTEHDREAIEVVYIDHNHFHMVGDVEPYTTPNL
ncbi:MAG: hypothetical protein MI861_00500 [Pirellulales bacterium]|nr:hypothetical protein [Pirellulales bacterium]